MKVLILTYYWPPSGGSGVQRWLKFVKYLREFGIEPIVYTVKNPLYPIEDENLENEIPDGVEVLRHSIKEPNNLLGNKKGTSAGFLNPNPTLIGKIAQYIRANFFIPDARKFWIKPSVKFLSGYLKENSVDVIISTGPPHSMHMIGKKLKEKFDIKWISDFRDPWTDIDYFHQLPLSKSSIKKHKKLEQEVVSSSDAVLVVGKTMRENYVEFNKNIHVITNGYDVTSTQEKVKLDDKFSITHIGMMNDDRNPIVLWKVLSDICRENTDFKNDLEIKLIGKISDGCIEEIHNKNLENNLNFIDYLPHNKINTHQQTSQILLLAINDVPSSRGIITGKIFEYLNANRPILGIGPVDGDLSEILNQTNAGITIDFKDEVSLKSSINEFYRLYKGNNLQVYSMNIEQYHRRNLTLKLSGIIKNLN